MQPTQQNVVPVDIFRGSVPPGDATEIPLDPTYDHVISKIVAITNNPSPDYVEIDDQDYNWIWGSELPPSTSPINGPVVEGGEGIVLQSLSGLYIYFALGVVFVTISAYRLNPSADYLFS